MIEIYICEKYEFFQCTPVLMYMWENYGKLNSLSSYILSYSTIAAYNDC